MSRCYSKVTIDLGWVYTYHEIYTFYVEYDNTTDYQRFYLENGDIMELHGSDDFMYALGRYLLDEEYDPVTHQSVGFYDLPEAVQKAIKGGTA